LEQKINQKQNKNLVISIDSNSNHDQYPSAKLLYTIKTDLEQSINTKQVFNLVRTINEYSTDEQYPSAKLLYDIIGDCDEVLDEISALIGE
jgi:hypothetical protein